MNKAFKVLWNDVRGSYVVSSENHLSHGKPAKSARTLVAAAVAGMLAIGTGSALAASTPVTNDSLSELGTTKFYPVKVSSTFRQKAMLMLWLKQSSRKTSEPFAMPWDITGSTQRWLVRPVAKTTGTTKLARRYRTLLVF